MYSSGSHYPVDQLLTISNHGGIADTPFRIDRGTSDFPCVSYLSWIAGRLCLAKPRRFGEHEYKARRDKYRVAQHSTASLAVYQDAQASTWSSPPAATLQEIRYTGDGIHTQSIVTSSSASGISTPVAEGHHTGGAEAP
jgi:hypothetical protein